MSKPTNLPDTSRSLDGREKAHSNELKEPFGSLKSNSWGYVTASGIGKLANETKLNINRIKSFPCLSTFVSEWFLSAVVVA